MSVFSCPTCLRRAIQNLSLENAVPSVTAINRSISQIRKPQERGHATYDSIVRGHHRRTLRSALADRNSIAPNARRKGAGSLTKGEIKDALARENNRSLLLRKDDGSGAVSQPNDERRQLARLKEDIEKYYTDPMELSNVVTAKLRTPDFAKALALVRASEGIVIHNVVSWNHCIDFCMAQGDTDQAWKLYNELKKRGHRPDSHTYTIMLRGLSRNSRKKNTAQRAVGIYNSMFAPNSAVEPSTIHTNAILNVCARTGDMESLWAIAGRLPERGPGAPDRWTFTTILNAIREDATARVADLLKNPDRTAREGRDRGNGGLGLEERQKVIFDDALRDGRKLWADVSYRWRRADLTLDEQLVCAMGRLILGCGMRKDFSEVLDLVDSTMNIKLAERGHKKGFSTDDSHQEDADQEPENAKDFHTRGEMVMVSGQDSQLPLSHEQVYATPGRNTLSLILEASLGLKEMKVGKAYWHVLTTPTGPFKVAPDANNIIAYLRLLRIARSSKDALAVLQRDWPADVAESLYRRGTFVIAMSTCVRDKNNPNIFDTADQLLSLMQDKLEETKIGMYSTIEGTEKDASLSYKERRAAAKSRLAEMDDVTFGEDEALSEVQRTKSGVESSIVDPKALRMYLDLAVWKTEGWNEGIKGRDDSDQTFERNATKNMTLRALRRLGPDTINIGRLARLKLLESEINARSSTPKVHRNPDRAGTRVAERLDDMVDLLRSMVSAYDKVISTNERFEDTGRPTINTNLVDGYRDAKRRISGFLSRSKDEVQKITRGDFKYVQWRNQKQDPIVEEDERDDEDEDEDTHHPPAPSRRHGNTTRQPHHTDMPKLARDVRKIYDDTDRSLGRLDHRSRRQRLERSQGVQRRLMKRLGVGQDLGVLDDDLNIQRKEEVELRMRKRAFGIEVRERSGLARVGSGDVVAAA